MLGLLFVSLDDIVKVGFIIWEVLEQCVIRVSTKRRGAYDMNITKKVSNGENYLIMESP